MAAVCKHIQHSILHSFRGISPLLVRGVNYRWASRVAKSYSAVNGLRKPARDEERSMSTVAMNQMFRVGVGFAAWCALRQVLMVWLTYV